VSQMCATAICEQQEKSRPFTHKTRGFGMTSLAFDYCRRQGERSGHWRMASVAQAVVLSAWQAVHGLDDVGHRRFAPVLVNLQVAFLAGNGAGVVS
jgi:hypothetical protein